MKTAALDDATSNSHSLPRGWRRIAPALAYRNYRLFIAGQGVSLIGTWMQQLGVSWLAYQLTGSAWLLGLVNFSGQLPALFLTVPAGVFADRWNRYRALAVMQTLAMFQSLALVWVVWRGNVQIWEMIVLSTINGVLNALEMPSRQSFLTEMVSDRHDLANAVALNSSMVNGARLIGPFLAGVLIALGGVISCFIGNAISFLAVLIALAMMRDLPPSRPHHTGPLVKGLVDGVRYAVGFTPIRRLLLVATLASFTGASLSLLMPIYADKILLGGPGLLGSLTGASGVGALGAALYLLARRSVLGLGRWLVGTGLAFGVALLGFAWSGSVPLSLGLLVVTGFSMMFQMATCNTLLQTIVEEDKRRPRNEPVFARLFRNRPAGKFAGRSRGRAVRPRPDPDFVRLGQRDWRRSFRPRSARTAPPNSPDLCASRNSSARPKPEATRAADRRRRREYGGTHRPCRESGIGGSERSQFLSLRFGDPIDGLPSA